MKAVAIFDFVFMSNVSAKTKWKIALKQKESHCEGISRKNKRKMPAAIFNFVFTAKVLVKDKVDPAEAGPRALFAYFL